MKMQSLTLALVLILGAALIMFAVQSLAAPQAENLSPALPSALFAPVDWQLESVEIGAHVDSGTALALDPSTQHPRIAYGYEAAPGEPRVLKYAWYNGATWQTETVSNTNGMRGHLSLAVDGEGHRHVSYYVDTGNLKRAWYDGAIWHVETVDNSVNVGQYTSLALDSSNRPRISYFDDNNDDLKYALYNGTAWDITTVDSAGDVGQYTSLALDQLDRPHISYFDNDNGDLKYAWYNGTTWKIETVDSQGNVGWYSSLELDAADRPHISYFGVGLKYARYDGASWHIETVDAGFDIGWFSSLALDGVGLPHIAYCDTGERDLKYAWFDSQAWHIETVDSAGLAGWNTSMEVDEQGRARISYYEFNAKELKHARRLYAHLFLDKQASPSGHVRNGDTLTYTLTLFGPGLDISLADPLPDNVSYVSDSITYTVPTVAYSPTLHAVVWKGTMPTDTIQEVSFQVTVDVPGADPSELAPTIYNTAVLTDTARGVSISSTAVVNRFVYLPIIVRMQ